MWHGLILDHNYERDGVKGLVYACDLKNGFVTGFRHTWGQVMKTPFRMKLENFTKHYYLSAEQ